MSAALLSPGLAPLRVRPGSPRRAATAPAAWPAWRILAIGALLIVGLVVRLDFSVDWHDFTVLLIVLGIWTGAALLLRRGGRGRLADALEGTALIVASGMMTGCLCVLLATMATPLADPVLAAADRVLFPFLSWPAMARALMHHGGVVAVMQSIYSTLLWQPLGLVALLALRGRGAVMWRFVHAWLLALVVCIAIFALVPAVTAQVHYGFRPHSIAGLTVNAGWRPASIILQVRSGALRTLASGSMTGLVSFPSFHAMGATLLGWGFARAGRLAWPMVALDAAMIPTIPLIGSHYFVDVAAGIVLAVIVIVATRPRRNETGAPLPR